MQITVTIPDEFAAQVQARGQTPESFVEKLIAEQIASPIEKAARSISLAPRRSGPERDMNAFFKALAANSDKLPKPPDEAFTRESFYQDHD
jgi:hypothetical protein